MSARVQSTPLLATRPPSLPLVHPPPSLLACCSGVTGAFKFVIPRLAAGVSCAPVHSWTNIHHTGQSERRNSQTTRQTLHDPTRTAPPHTPRSHGRTSRSENTSNGYAHQSHSFASLLHSPARCSSFRCVVVCVFAVDVSLSMSALPRASGRDPLNTFAVMEDVNDKLKLLHYEDAILKKRTDLKPISRTYFALPGKPAEQFPYFAQLAVWALQQTGVEMEWSEWVSSAGDTAKQTTLH